MSDARSIRAIHHGAVGADDVHDTVDAASAAFFFFFFQRALFHFVWFQNLGVSGGDVTPQSPRGGRAELGSDARPRVLQEGKDRRRALENVAYAGWWPVKRQKRGKILFFLFF